MHKVAAVQKSTERYHTIKSEKTSLPDSKIHSQGTGERGSVWYHSLATDLGKVPCLCVYGHMEYVYQDQRISGEEYRLY